MKKHRDSIDLAFNSTKKVIFADFSHFSFVNDYKIYNYLPVLRSFIRSISLSSSALHLFILSFMNFAIIGYYLLNNSKISEIILLHKACKVIC